MTADRPEIRDAKATGRAFDELLVMLVQAGDRAAGERLARRWHPRLLRMARRLLQDEDAALSAVQESWVAICRGLPSLRDPAAFPAWAFSIVRRRSADRIRQFQTSRARDGGNAAEMPLAARDERTEERLGLLQAFKTLPEGQRLAAHLHYVEGLSLREIALVADIPEGTAKSRLFHARQSLKRALDHHEGETDDTDR